MKYNKSKTYLLPLLAELINLDFKFMPFVENTFLEDNLGNHIDSFLIMHDFNFKNPEFTNYEHKFIDTELYDTLYDIGNKVLYVFKFPEEFMKEYNLYKQSKYSEFGEDAKKVILEFWTKIYGNNPGAITFLTTVKNILYKDESFRKKREESLGVTLPIDSELGEYVDIKEETYEFENEEVNDG